LFLLPASSFYYCADGIPTENANCDSARLFGLRNWIFGLQRDRKFPECELSKLNLLTEKQDLHWDTPALIQPSESWDTQFNPLEIFDAVRWSIQRLSLDCVCRAGQPIEGEGWDWEISNAFYQATVPLDSSDASGKSSLMNISLPEKFHRLRPCQTLRDQLRIVNDNNVGLLANFAPAGSTTDIHIGSWVICASSNAMANFT
jgi:hypothetical protein